MGRNVRHEVEVEVEVVNEWRSGRSVEDSRHTGRNPGLDGKRDKVGGGWSSA